MTASVASKRTGGEGASGRAALAARLRPWLPALRYCAGVYLVVRVALFALGAAAWALTSEHMSVAPNGSVPALTNGWHNAITGWNKQDSLWFLHIARDGYSPGNASGAFYPAYPVLIRVVGYVCAGHLLLAAYIVANGALLAALVIFYRLTEWEFDRGLARRSVLYLCLFPTAFFLFDTYSEALFLLAAVAAIALARRGRWVWAGVAGAGATLTRSTGVIVVLALLAEAVHQTVEDRRASAGAGDASHGGVGRGGAERGGAGRGGAGRGGAGRGGAGRGGAGRGLAARAALRVGSSLLALAGIGGYLLFWQLRYGDWYRPIRLENAIWGRQFGLPWHTLWQGMTMAWRYGSIGGDGWWTLDFLLVAAGLVLGVWVAVRTRPVYVVYTWGSLVLFLCAAWPDRPLISDPRYLVTIFPLIWPLARLGRRPGAHDAVVAVSAASMVIVGWLFLSTTLIF